MCHCRVRTVKPFVSSLSSLLASRTWPMRLYWRWARRLRLPISWLCRPRGPSSTRTSQWESAQRSSRPDPADLCPNHVAVCASQRWVGSIAVQKKHVHCRQKATFEVWVAYHLYLKRDKIEIKKETSRRVLWNKRRNMRLLKPFQRWLQPFASTSDSLLLLDTYAQCTCFSLSCTSRGHHDLLNSTYKSER